MYSHRVNTTGWLARAGYSNDCHAYSDVCAEPAAAETKAFCTNRQCPAARSRYGYRVPRVGQCAFVPASSREDGQCAACMWPLFYSRTYQTLEDYKNEKNLAAGCSGDVDKEPDAAAKKKGRPKKCETP